MKLFELVSTAYATTHDVVGDTTELFNFDNFFFLRPFGGGDDATNLSAVFGSIVGLVLLVAAIVAFFYLIVSGFQYMTAGGEAEKATKARQGIINAIIGIIVILVSYIIITYVAGFIGGAGDNAEGGGVFGFIQQLI